MHNLIFCCLCIVAASKDVRHRVSRADSNFKKNPKKVLRYDYILVMANKPLFRVQIEGATVI